MSEVDIEFVVQGKPVPQGSLRAFYNKKANRSVLIHQNDAELKDWRFSVRYQAEKAMLANRQVLDDDKKRAAYAVTMQFYFQKPQSVKHEHKNTKPDLDKLIRAVLDSLTGTCFSDDARVTKVYASKEFTTNGREYCIIKVRKLTEKEKGLQT